jgi:hypothetical protein
MKDPRKIDHDPLAQIEATLNSGTPDNTTQDEQTAGGDRFISFSDTITFHLSCREGDGAVLSRKDMYSPVADVIADLSKGIYPMSTEWGVNLPGNDDITIWLWADIIEGGPLVNTVLLRNMFQMVVYHQSCYVAGGTRGGSILAVRTGQWSRKLANVGIYAVDAREV